MPIGYKVDRATTPQAVAEILNRHAKQTHFCQEMFNVGSAVWVYHTKLDKDLRYNNYDHKYYCRSFKTSKGFNKWLEGVGRSHQLMKIITVNKEAWVISYKRGVVK